MARSIIYGQNETSGYGPVQIEHDSLAMVPTSYNDTNNTTIIPLGSGSTYTGTWTVSTMPDVLVSCKCDNSGTLYFDFSNDGTNVDTFPVNGFAVASGIHEFHTALKGARQFRVRLVNDVGAQTYLRLYTYLGSFSKSPNAPLNQSIGADSDATITKSILAGADINGSYNNVLVSTNQELFTNTLASDKKSRVCYKATGIATTSYYCLIDLSDTTNFPHSETGAIDIDHYSLSVNFTTGSAQATIKIGVITRIDGTDADISNLIEHIVGVQSANDGVIVSENYEPSSVLFKVSGGSLVGSITSDTDTNNTSVNTGITLDSPNGLITPAVGDLIITAEYVADTFDMSVAAIYHSDP